MASEKGGIPDGIHREEVKRVEVSAGGLVFKKIGGQWHVLVVKNSRGVWVFPKGHVEDGEDIKVAAEREVFEETGVVAKAVKYAGSVRYTYSVGDSKVEKIVHFFVMRYVSGKPHPDKVENVSACFIPLTKVHKLLSYENLWRVYQKAMFDVISGSL